LGETDRLIIRKFTNGLEPGEDPFLGFELVAGRLNKLPILAQTMCYLECELACHMDVEGDHDLFVGHVRGGGYNGGKPAIHVRTHGYDY
jgi:flavin reductase (DIM6/NTAB) family NADH-FMN oxidoreductase RutF